MRAELERVLWPNGSRNDVWAIVDGARDKRAYWSLVNSYLQFSCLFEGQLPEVVERVAPYLVELSRGDSFTQFVMGEWGNSLGIYLECDRSLKELRHHLRKLLTVTDGRGARMLFRFYDPRVLRAYLPTCQLDELKTVFGPIQAFWMESRNGNALLEFRFNGRALVKSEHLRGGLG